MLPLLELENLSVGFFKTGKTETAVNRLSFAMPKSSISCLVGESGCGKSLTCKAILRLLPENAFMNGTVKFNNRNLTELPLKELRKVRGAEIGMIFQEPMTSLNPVLTIGSQTAEPLEIHLKMNKKEAREKVIELFHAVGIPSPAGRFSDYPHQLSGGMRQRVMIAMALSCNPALLLADEPTTALDTTIQGQILDLISEQSQTRGMGVLLITHDLAVAAEIADQAGVMYAGLLAETAMRNEIFKNPLHPYTQGLIACAPSKASAGLLKLPVIPGYVPSLADIPAGCPFEPRCSKKMPVCKKEMPPVITENCHSVRCWLYQK